MTAERRVLHTPDSSVLKGSALLIPLTGEEWERMQEIERRYGSKGDVLRVAAYLLGMTGRTEGFKKPVVFVPGGAFNNHWLFAGIDLCPYLTELDAVRGEMRWNPQGYRSFHLRARLFTQHHAGVPVVSLQVGTFDGRGISLVGLIQWLNSDHDLRTRHFCALVNLLEHSKLTQDCLDVVDIGLALQQAITQPFLSAEDDMRQLEIELKRQYRRTHST